jgi:hypothetical protein
MIEQLDFQFIAYDTGPLFPAPDIRSSVSVEPFHLFRYLDEQAFRYNNRENMDDGDRFSAVVSQITSKRLTYQHLIAKDASTTPDRRGN